LHFLQQKGEIEKAAKKEGEGLLQMMQQRKNGVKRGY
jgi:hypothetical protein